jgi:hypothetical protein
VINLFYGCGAWGESKVTDQSPQPVSDRTPRFRRLRFSNISARRVKYSAAYVIGLPELSIEDVAFNDVSVYLDPENTEAGQSAMAPGQPDLCRAGFVMRNVEHARLNGVQVFNQIGEPITMANCKDVVVTNCTMIHGHGGVVIGSEMSGGVRNVAISNCTFVGTDRGIRIKSRRGRGGVVEDIRVSNIVMDQVLCPLAINLFYGCGAWDDPKVLDKSPKPVDETTPRFRRLRFSNITARRAKYSACFVIGLPEMFVEDIAYSDVSIYLDEDNTEAGESDMAPGIEKLCRGGFVVRNVDGLRLDNVQVNGQIGPAVRVYDSRDVVLTNVTTRTRSDTPPIVRENVA